MQRIDVYQGDELVASFPWQGGPVYYGAAGQRVRELVNANHPSYDPWGSGFDYAGLSDESPTALLASVAAAVHGHGYTVTPVGFTFPASVRGVAY